MRSLILLSCHIIIVASVQRWYYTGNYRPDRNEPIAKQWFDGLELDFMKLFDSNTINSNQPILYSGNLVILPDTEPKSQLEDSVLQYLLRNISLISPHSSEQLEVLSSYSYNIHGMDSYGKIEVVSEDNSTWSLMEEEIGLFDTVTNVFIERHWRYTKFGVLYVIQAIENIQSTTNNIETVEPLCKGQTEEGEVSEGTCGAIDNTPSPTSNDRIQHNAIFTLDLYRRPTLVFHTRMRLSPKRNSVAEAAAKPSPAVVLSNEKADVEVIIDVNGNLILPTPRTTSEDEQEEIHVQQSILAEAITKY